MAPFRGRSMGAYHIILSNTTKDSELDSKEHFQQDVIPVLEKGNIFAGLQYCLLQFTT